MSEELKACPFCGGEVELIHDHTIEDVDRIRHKVPSFNCPINGATGLAIGNENLVTAWNTRAPASEPGEAMVGPLDADWRSRLERLEANSHPPVDIGSALEEIANKSAQYALKQAGFDATNRAHEIVDALKALAQPASEAKPDALIEALEEADNACADDDTAYRLAVRSIIAKRKVELAALAKEPKP